MFEDVHRQVLLCGCTVLGRVTSFRTISAGIGRSWCFYCSSTRDPQFIADRHSTPKAWGKLERWSRLAWPSSMKKRSISGKRRCLTLGFCRQMPGGPDIGVCHRFGACCEYLRACLKPEASLDLSGYESCSSWIACQQTYSELRPAVGLFGSPVQEEPTCWDSA